MFVELSVDGGETFQAAQGSAHMELVQPGVYPDYDLKLPPTEGEYDNGEEFLFLHAIFDQLSAYLKEIIHRPLSGADVSAKGWDEHEVFDSTLSGKFVMTVNQARVETPFDLTGPVETVVRDKVGRTTGSFDAAILSMDLRGDVQIPGGPTLPVVIRESPSLASQGQTTLSHQLGTLTIDGELEMMHDSEYIAELGAQGNDLIRVTSDAFLAGRLSLKAIANLGDIVSPQGWGDKTRTIVETTGAEGTIEFEFDEVPAVGEHLGFGVFFQDMDYQPSNTDVHVLQAAAGDTNGDREVNNADLQQILGCNAFNQPPQPPGRWDWQCGDFDGAGWSTMVISSRSWPPASSAPGRMRRRARASWEAGRSSCRSRGRWRCWRVG